MKWKLNVLGLCFLTTNVQWAVAHAQPAGAAATTGSAVAAMGVGTVTQQTPPVVGVESGQLQGVIDGVVVSFKGIPCGAPCGRPAVAAASARGAVDRRAPGDGIWGGLYAGTVRPAPRVWCASGAGVVGRLSVPKRLESR